LMKAFILTTIILIAVGMMFISMSHKSVWEQAYDITHPLNKCGRFSATEKDAYLECLNMTEGEYWKAVALHVELLKAADKIDDDVYLKCLEMIKEG